MQLMNLLHLDGRICCVKILGKNETLNVYQAYGVNVQAKYSSMPRFTYVSLYGVYQRY